MKGIYKYFLLIASALIFSFGFNVFLRFSNIAPGGITGISLLINHLIPPIPVGALSLIFNAPLLLMGFKKIGGDFVIKSAFCSLLISVFFDLHFLFPTVNADPLLSAIFGGVIIGIAMGLAFLAGGSTGGIDILIRILRKKYPMLSIGQLLLLMDMLVILSSALVFRSINSALYAMITMYVTSISLDAVLYGLNYAKCALVITDKGKAVSDALLQELMRGTTVIPCLGGYSAGEKSIVLCAIKKGQLTALKEGVARADPTAFVIMCDATEVMGLGFHQHGKNSF